MKLGAGEIKYLGQSNLVTHSDALMVQFWLNFWIIDHCLMVFKVDCKEETSAFEILQSVKQNDLVTQESVLREIWMGLWACKVKVCSQFTNWEGLLFKLSIGGSGFALWNCISCPIPFACSPAHFALYWRKSL